MSARADGTDPYAGPEGASPDPLRWVIWNSPTEVMVFDRDINGPVPMEDERTLREVLRRMREAGVPESDDYPGLRCS
ncbi:hypothetical protein OHB05_01600 [Streptomyces sp. NBC_00638]|uniref:hypothetical protein n=1 Tax=unclassified Streptomyces TaxID=2593676 RepID=UPI00224DD0C3|nr:hypothetical protein [Streptomyces sp. NBC_00638]MCX5001324.1 hypothetical protein [Streptomyces sp. NBC_00638]